MKKFKKAILYLLTYVLVTFSTAFGVVLISNPTGANSVKIEENTDTVAIAPQLNYIMNKLGTVDALSANINANIKTKSDSYKVGLCVDADLSAGFEKAELSGEVNVEINNAEPINVDLVYKQENIYISVLNGNYQVATNNIVSSITQILTLLNVELPELNLGIDLETLSLTTVLEMLSNLTEQKTNEDKMWITISKIT